MLVDIVNVKNFDIAVIRCTKKVIKDVRTALDILISIKFEKGCDYIIIDKSFLCEEFFQLSTGLAGEILQKFINYQVKVAIIGDFSEYTSKSFKDFVYECNKGENIFFLQNEKEAKERLIGLTVKI
jgi:hypothetical protein